MTYEQEQTEQNLFFALSDAVKEQYKDHNFMSSKLNRYITLAYKEMLKDATKSNDNEEQEL